MPDFEFENKLWKQGFRVVAGADEVGRGSWAGPIVACAVAWPRDFQFTIFNFQKIKINDSKKLTKPQREKAEKWIKENCLAWGIGEAPVSAINKYGLVKASNIAFRRAIRDCEKRFKIQFLLIDAFFIPHTRGLRRKNQKTIIKGDSKSYSIAAASILAKVYRDNLMEKLSQKHKKYGWDKNCGYGTKSHQEAILKHGATKLHRKLFLRKLLG